MIHGRHVYTLRTTFTNPGAVTLLQLKAGTNEGFTILRAWIAQSSSTTSAANFASIIRKSAAATVTAAVVGTTLFKHDPLGPTPDLSLGTTATGHTATGEGTDGDTIYSEGFNLLNGWLYVPVPEERVFVNAGGIIGLKLGASFTGTLQAGVTVLEH